VTEIEVLKALRLVENRIEAGGDPTKATAEAAALYAVPLPTVLHYLAVKWIAVAKARRVLAEEIEESVHDQLLELRRAAGRTGGRPKGSKKNAAS